MKKNKILFITTKAITQNVFFKEFIGNNPFDLTLGCSDIANLVFSKKKIQFNFINNFWQFLNPFLFIFIIFFIYIIHDERLLIIKKRSHERELY